MIKGGAGESPLGGTKSKRAGVKEGVSIVQKGRCYDFSTVVLGLISTIDFQVEIPSGCPS